MENSFDGKSGKNVHLNKAHACFSKNKNKKQTKKSSQCLFEASIGES